LIRFEPEFPHDRDLFCSFGFLLVTSRLKNIDDVSSGSLQWGPSSILTIYCAARSAAVESDEGIYVWMELCSVFRYEIVVYNIIDLQNPENQRLKKA